MSPPVISTILLALFTNLEQFKPQLRRSLVLRRAGQIFGDVMITFFALYSTSSLFEFRVDVRFLLYVLKDVQTPGVLNTSETSTIKKNVRFLIAFLKDKANLVL